ncbi:MAG: acyl carrier protein [candidate division NC10 bacterium]|jgi:acyl carrier protein|nr:acyl carrier protein [candidate division NC10 bacterium]
MERGAIANTLRSFITENYLLGRDFTFADGDSFLEHSIIDSIGILQLVTFLQDTYGITVQDSELLPENLDSIDAVTAYLCRKLDGAASAGSPAGSQGAPGERA